MRIQKDTVCAWISAQKMFAHKTGRLWKFRWIEIDELIRSGEVAPSTVEMEDPTGND